MTRPNVLPSAICTASAPRIGIFRGSMAGLCAPLSTLRRNPRGQLRMTRGRCGSLLLHRKRLALSTPCRSPSASRTDIVGSDRMRPKLSAGWAFAFRLLGGPLFHPRHQILRPSIFCLKYRPDHHTADFASACLELVSYISDAFGAGFRLCPEWCLQASSDITNRLSGR
jgi:hypothetical protein